MDTETAIMEKIERETDKEANERSKWESLAPYADGAACDKLMGQLEVYRYIADVADIHVGKYIRWINKTELEKEKEKEKEKEIEIEIETERKPPVLTMGGVVTRVHKLQEWSIFVYNKYTRSNIQIKYKDALVYQKLTDIERLILAIRSQK
jgi:hypothetical protein